MSRVFDVADEKSMWRRSDMISSLPKAHSVFEDYDRSGTTFGFQQGRPPSPRLCSRWMEDLAKVNNSLCNVVYVVWFVCCLSIFAPYGVEISRGVREQDVNFPYNCRLFFLSLVVGLPAASVHLFCCALCFFSKKRVGLVLSVLSIFSHILTVEFNCGFDKKSSVPIYLLAFSIYSGAFSQMIFIESIRDFHSENRRRRTTFVFTLLLTVTTISVLTTMLCDIFQIVLPLQQTLYLRLAPMVAAVAIYLLTTMWTLRPVFLVINSLSSPTL